LLHLKESFPLTAVPLEHSIKSRASYCDDSYTPASFCLAQVSWFSVSAKVVDIQQCDTYPLQGDIVCVPDAAVVKLARFNLVLGDLLGCRYGCQGKESSLEIHDEKGFRERRTDGGERGSGEGKATDTLYPLRVVWKLGMECFCPVWNLCTDIAEPAGRDPRRSFLPLPGGHTWEYPRAHNMLIGMAPRD